MKRMCAICGGQDKKIIHVQRFLALDGPALLSGYEVVACKRCGFTFADSVPKQSELDRYYEEMSKYENPERSGAPDEHTLETYRAIATTLAQHLPDRAIRILDVGCATGGLLNEMKRLGYNHILGLDPSPTCVKIANESFGIQVLQGSILAPPPLKEHFDLLIANSVLEHICQLDLSLQVFCDLLVPGGFIWAEVPDVTRFAEFATAPFQQFSVEHINYFSKRTLSELFNGFGFECRASFRNVRRLGGTKDPALSCIFRRCSCLPIPVAWDPADQEAVSKYVERSRHLSQEATLRLRRVVERGEAIIVWGVGTHTLRLLAEGDLARANIVAFVDSSPHYQGRTLMNIPVLSPDTLHVLPNRILISSRVYQEMIRRQIEEELGLKNGVITLYED